MSLRKLETEKEYEASKVMNSMYSFKLKYNDNEHFATTITKEQKLSKLGKQRK